MQIVATLLRNERPQLPASPALPASYVQAGGGTGRSVIFVHTRTSPHYSSAFARLSRRIL